VAEFKYAAKARAAIPPSSTISSPKDVVAELQEEPIIRSLDEQAAAVPARWRRWAHKPERGSKISKEGQEGGGGD
jgi:hypothetical protein